MKRTASKAVAFFLSISMIFSACSVPMNVLADDGDPAGALTMENHSIKWIDGSSNTVIDGDNLTITPNSNGGSSVTARVTYSCGGNEVVEAGKAVIRIPRYIFEDRTGMPVGEVELSIPKAPATGGATSFNYTIDTKGDDDPKNDEIVISNYKDIPAGGFFMRSDIVWTFGAVDVANGFTNSSIKAEFSTQGNGGGAAITAESEAITAKVVTKVDVGSISKKEGEKKENWQNAWGPRPADADDYYYVVWNLNLNVRGTTTTSPYTVTFEDIPGAVDKEGNTDPGDKNKGEVVAWANYCYNNNSKPTAYGTGTATDYKQGTIDEMNSEPVRVNNTKDEINSITGTYIARDVVMRYPKNLIPEKGDTPTLKNGFKATVTTPEGNVVQKADIGNYKYQRVNFEVEYPGDILSMYKRQRGGYLASTGKSTYSFAGGLNMLQNDTAVEADWSIGIRNMSWEKSQGGTKDYDTVLRDGMMYVAGERLTPEDYELTKFYPVQYNIFAPVTDEDKGASLDISTDYAKDYKPIKVEIKDASGNWTTYGTLTKLGAKTYSWDGPGAKTEKYDSSNATNAKAAISLPEGTQDIRFTHTDRQYGVEYNMALFYKLKPSTHLKQLIGENSASFELMNINEGWGAQENEQGNKEIYTTGNKFSDASTPSIAKDVEASDNEEFGGVSVVAHDFAAHRFTLITPSGNFSKSMTKTNDTANQRVKIPVNMTWDYYYNFSALGVDINDAIDADIIKEQRNADFYDLLPAGVTVDMNSINARVYSSTNVDGKTVPKCDYTVEMIDNWRASGRTMMIVHVKAPDGYRNFAKSTTWVDTGFKLSFTMYDSWDNIEVNGSNIVNEAAYYSRDGSVVKGVSDTGEGSTSKDLFENLAGGDGDSELKNNVRYTKAPLNVNVPRAAQMGFSKKVKGAGDIAYTDKTAVPAMGDYSYQMRFALQDNANAKGLVLYDVLEKAYGNNEHWNGTFRGIDVSQIRRTFPDTDVKVYYSTSPDFGNLQGDSGTNFTDLTNEGLWTTAVPDDLSKVTAVAVDMSKDKNGKEINYKGPIAVNAVVLMQAPANYKDYIDNKETVSIDETKYAYNQAFLKQAGEKLEGSETTKVSMTRPDIRILKASDPATGTAAAPRGVTAGGTIDYTVDVTNKNTADGITGVKVKDNVPEGLVVDGDALAYYFGSQKSSKKTVDGTGRVTAEVTGQTVTFSIDKLDAGETAHLIIPVRIKDSAAGGTEFVNSAEITEFNGEEWDDYESNKTYHKTQSTTVELPVAKEIAGKNRVPQYEKDFTFTLEGVDGAPMPSGNVNVKTIHDEGNALFGSIEYTKPGDYKYIVKEAKGSDTGYTYDETVHHITVHIKYENGRFVTAWEDEDGKEGEAGIIFTNSYQPKPVKLALPVTKVLGGDPIPDGHEETFRFEMVPIGAGTPVPDSGKLTTAIDGLGNAHKVRTGNFDEITFTEPGLYLYQVREIIGTIPGYKYAFDASSHTISVLVTDNDGQLATNWKEDDEEVTGIPFNNDYEPNADIISLKVTKSITGNSRPEKYKKSFRFNLSEPEYNGPFDYAAAGEKLPMPKSAVTTIGDEGTGTLGQIAIKHAGTYTYTITEQNSGAAGYKYDNSRWKAVVTAVDTGGQIESTIVYRKATETEGNTEAAGFVNDYIPEKAEAQFDITKVVKGNVPDGGNKTFTFRIEAEGNAPSPAGGSTVSIKGDGTVSGGTVTFTKAGTYKYTVSETKGFDKGYIYSDDVYNVTVKVTDNDGVLEKEVTYLKSGRAADAITFENRYEPAAAEFYPAVTKTVSGNERDNKLLKKFSFNLESVNNGPLPEGRGSTATVTDEGDAAFGKISFTKAGTYLYKITEQDTGEKGYSYSDEEYTLEVTVTDDNGVLKADAVYKDRGDNIKDDALFENTYAPDDVSNTVSVRKLVSGQERPDDNLKTFSFELEPQDGAPMPEGDGNTVSITDEGTGDFGEITYEKAGTYKYTVAETAGNETGYKYSEDVYEVTVTVTDDDGVLKKKVAYAVNGEARDRIEFTNVYLTEKAWVTLSADKVIDGDKRRDKDRKTFEFELKSGTDTPMPEAGGEKASVRDEGTAGFGKIIYDRPGTYIYEVTEKNSGEKGYTYDKSVYTVTVEVIDHNGLLEAQTSYKKGDAEADRIVFTNKYKCEASAVTSSKTGDDSNPAGWLAAMLLSGLAALLAAVRHRRRNCSFH